jgi:hypothetical protein
MMGTRIASAAAWSSSPLDDCLDHLGSCESEVTECRLRVEVLEAANTLLQHPLIIVFLGVALAALAAMELIRQVWHLQAGAVPGAFPVDRVLGWLCRRIGRVLRPLLCARVERAAGPEAAAAVGEVLDPFLVSPPAASTPAAAVVTGRPRLATPTPHRVVLGSRRSEPPPAPPPSLATVWMSARSAPPHHSSRSSRSIERSAFDLSLAARRLEAGPPSLQMELDRLNRPYDNVR